MAPARNTRANQVTSLELLWGTRSQPSREPRPGLSVEKIAATVIEIADEEGIEAVSMKRIAGRLGYTAMSLYRHVPGKEQLIDISYDIALGQPSPAEDSTGDWRTEVNGWVRDVLAVYTSHPWLSRITTSTPPLGPNQLAWFDALLRPLSGLGLGEDEMVHLVIFIAGTVRDLARTSVDLAKGTEQAGVSVEEMGEGYALAMKRLADSSDFPALFKLFSAGTFEPGETPYNDIMPSLDFGLQRLLDGVETYVRSRNP